MRAGPAILDTLVNKYVIFKNITNLYELPVQENNTVQVNNRRPKKVWEIYTTGKWETGRQYQIIGKASV